MKKYIDLTDMINESTFHDEREIKALVNLFDIEIAPRDQVNHYPIENIGKNQPEFIADQLNAMYQCAWLTFRHYVRDALMEKNVFGGDMFDVFTSPFKVGKIKIVPPHNFAYLNTPLDELKVFAFQYIRDDGQVHIKAEINFSIELYN
jgi:hypothetical protein